MQANHCQYPKAIPLTQEEISILVFKKSGIVKGLGMKPSFSLVTTASSSSLVEYIHRLESEIIELKEQELGTKRSELGMKRSELGNKRRKLSKKRSKRIFLTF